MRDPANRPDIPTYHGQPDHGSLDVVVSGCSRGNDEAKPAAAESALPTSVSERLNQPFTGDLDEMVKRRLVRIGVTFNRAHYFVDKGVQRGGAYEYGKLMED